MDRAANAAGRVEVEEPARLSNTVFNGPCTLGAFTYFNHGAEVANADIGRYCSIGQRALIGPGEHWTDYVTTHPIGADPSGFSAGMSTSSLYRSVMMTAASGARAPRGRTSIGHDVWIGANAVVMQGVSVGVGAVIGAGAIVTRDVEPFAVVAGSPARLLRHRLAPELQAAVLASRWWTLELSRLPVRDYSDVRGFLRELAARRPGPMQPRTVRVS